MSNSSQSVNQEVNSTATSSYGTLTLATGASSGKDHGLIVSTIAAGEDDGVGMQGVAPGASLHWASYDQINGNSYYPTHWANATDNAAYHDAVVQNNSWGATNSTIATVNTYKTNNSLTNSAALAAYFTAGGLSSDEASVNTYVTSLNNFQDKKRLIKELNDSQFHRGPDDSGFYNDNFLSLGFRRLSIIDLENGNQPIIKKNIVTIYNGEIYNFVQLRNELIELGAEFYSKSDSEVVANAFLFWGIDCLKKFDGMFAICFYDQNKKEIFLARDRMGIKPLHYTIINN